MSLRSTHQRWPIAAAWGLVAVGAITDQLTPLGFAHASLFVLAVLVTAEGGRRSSVAVVAAASAVLAVVGYFTSPPPPVSAWTSIVIGNRLVSILLIAGTALLAARAVASARRDRVRAAELEALVDARARDARLMDIASSVAHIGGWSVDVPTLAVTWSDAVARIHGEPAGTSPSVDRALAYYHPEDRPLIAAEVEACIETGKAFDLELRILATGGRGQRWVRATGRAVRDAAGTIVTIEGAFQDVSQRVEVESALAAATEGERRRSDEVVAMLGRISDAFFTLDAEWRFGFVNAQAERVLERPSDELVGRVVWDAFPGAVGSPFEEHYRTARATGTMVQFEAYFEPLERWFEVRAHPTDDALAVFFRDVTERRTQAARWAMAQRMESVGQLTGGMAHDFNNLLTVVGGSADLLRSRLEDPSTERRLVDTILTATERGAKLTQSLLAFARQQPLDPKPVDAMRTLESMRILLERTLGEHVELLFDAPQHERLTTFVDPHQLESALLNLILNARDAMPDGGKVMVEVRRVELDEAYASSHEEVTAGAYVSFAVSDTGVGIEPEHVHRVFEPFYTTKEHRSGSGLGLAMVFGFAKQSRGHVAIYSEVGEGTTVRLYLPVHEAGPKRTGDPTSRPLELVGGRETIVLAEDDDLVRGFASEQLRDLGYDVHEARTGAEALALLDAFPHTALLFTDVVMPGGMNGRVLADTAVQRHPHLRVLYTSGYTENAIIHHGRLDEGVDLLSKPYRRADLARRVRSVLDASA